MFALLLNTAIDPLQSKLKAQKWLCARTQMCNSTLKTFTSHALQKAGCRHSKQRSKQRNKLLPDQAPSHKAETALLVLSLLPKEKIGVFMMGPHPSCSSNT